MPDSPPALDSPAPAWSRTILYYAARDALISRTDVILSRLGYQILLPETLATLQVDHPTLRADLRLVDERRMEEIPTAEEEGEGGSAAPIVLLSGNRGTTGADPRIVGAVKRPAGLHDLYRLMQQVFEDHPRSTPRVPTLLPAHCKFRGNAWESRVVSLSENGCLIRSPEAILLGQKVQLELVLPRGAAIALEAEATYQLLPDTGLVFNALPPSDREALGRYVTETILS